MRRIPNTDIKIPDQTPRRIAPEHIFRVIEKFLPHTENRFESWVFDGDEYVENDEHTITFNWEVSGFKDLQQIHKIFNTYFPHWDYRSIKRPSHNTIKFINLTIYNKPQTYLNTEKAKRKATRQYNRMLKYIRSNGITDDDIKEIIYHDFDGKKSEDFTSEDWTQLRLYLTPNDLFMLGGHWETFPIDGHPPEPNKEERYNEVEKILKGEN